MTKRAYIQINVDRERFYCTEVDDFLAVRSRFEELMDKLNTSRNFTFRISKCRSTVMIPDVLLRLSVIELVEV